MNSPLVYNPKRIHAIFRQLTWVLVLAFAVVSVALSVHYESRMEVRFFHGLLLSYWLLLGLLGGYLWRSYRQLAQNEFEVLQLNQEGTGIWLTFYGLKVRRYYIALDWLTLVPSRNGVELRYQHALQFNRHQQALVTAHGELMLSHRYFDKKQLNQFIKTLKMSNQQAILEHIARVKKQPVHRVQRHLVGNIITGVVIVAGMAIAWQPKTIPDSSVTPKTTTKKSHQAAGEGGDYHQKLNYQKDQMIETRQMKLTIHHLYQATTTEDEAVVIMNATAQPRTNQTNFMIAGHYFKLYEKWTLKAEADSRDFGDLSYKQNNLQIQDGTESRAVINVLTEGFSSSRYQSHGPETFNYIFKKPATDAFDITYQGFYYNLGQQPDEDEDTSAVIHVQSEQLEELTNG